MMRIRRFASLFLLPLAALMCVVEAPAASAQVTVTSPFAVSATVSATCLISTSPLAFGLYIGTQVTATTTLSVTCSNGTAYSVGLDAGTGGGTVTTRRMGGPGGATLNYALYSDPAMTTNWGNTPPTDTVAGTGSGIAQTLTIYGRVPGAQFPAAGSYTDTITATLTY